MTELTVKVLLLEEENLKLRNQIIENHMTIGTMHNVSNIEKFQIHIYQTELDRILCLSRNCSSTYKVSNIGRP